MSTLRRVGLLACVAQLSLSCAYRENPRLGTHYGRAYVIRGQVQSEGPLPSAATGKAIRAASGGQDLASTFTGPDGTFTLEVPCQIRAYRPGSGSLANLLAGYDPECNPYQVQLLVQSRGEWKVATWVEVPRPPSAEPLQLRVPVE